MKARQIIAGLVMITLAASGWAQQKEEAGEEVQPRFIWGLLIQLVVSNLASSAFDIFSRWLVTKLTGGASTSIDSYLASRLADSGAAISPRGAGGR